MMLRSQLLLRALENFSHGTSRDLVRSPRLYTSVRAADGELQVNRKGDVLA